MRHIPKADPPDEFVGACRSHNPQALPQWRNFGKGRGLKALMLDQLLREQGWVCCYCERTIAKYDSHIEHLESRATSPHLTYQWSNLFASCEDEKDKGKRPETCGHRKDNARLPVNHQQTECHARFRFGLDGSVRPSGVAGTPEHGEEEATIDCLGLDASHLRVLRTVAIDVVIQLLPMPDDPSYEAILAEEQARFRQRDSQGRWSPFSSAVLQVLEALA